MALDRGWEVLVWNFIGLYFLRSYGWSLFMNGTSFFDGQTDEVAKPVIS